MANPTNGEATSKVANCDDTHIGPLPTGAWAVTAIFHLRASALEAALIGYRTSFWPSGMTAAAAAPTPGGLKSMYAVIGALEPSLRSATIFRFMEPFCTRGALGSTMLSLNGTS